jgi:hypothetical protein
MKALYSVPILVSKKVLDQVVAKAPVAQNLKWRKESNYGSERKPKS